MPAQIEAASKMPLNGLFKRKKYIPGNKYQLYEHTLKYSQKNGKHLNKSNLWCLSDWILLYPLLLFSCSFSCTNTLQKKRNIYKTSSGPSPESTSALCRALCWYQTLEVLQGDLETPKLKPGRKELIFTAHKPPFLSPCASWTPEGSEEPLGVVIKGAQREISRFRNLEQAGILMELGFWLVHTQQNGFSSSPSES